MRNLTKKLTNATATKRLTNAASHSCKIIYALLLNGVSSEKFTMFIELDFCCDNRFANCLKNYINHFHTEHFQWLSNWRARLNAISVRADECPAVGAIVIGVLAWIHAVWEACAWAASERNNMHIIYWLHLDVDKWGVCTKTRYVVLLVLHSRLYTAVRCISFFACTLHPPQSNQLSRSSCGTHRMQQSRAIKWVRVVESWLTRVFTCIWHDGHVTLLECGPTGVWTTKAASENVVDCQQVSVITASRHAKIYRIYQGMNLSI